MIELLKLFLEFFKIGLFTFGGGYAMIPLVSEVVDLGWISQEQFNNMIGLSEVTPGPIALNMATFVGTTHAGFLGGLFATLGVVLPSYIIICIIAGILSKFSENKFIKAFLKGGMFVAIGLLIAITITMTLQTLTTFGSSTDFSVDLHSLKIFGFVLVGYILMWVITKKMPFPIPVIIMSLVIGLVGNIGWIPLIIAYALLIVILLLVRKKKATK